MKKLLLSLLTISALSASAQVPSGARFQFEFTNGSLANGAPTTAGDLSGSFGAITDRVGAIGNAAQVSSPLNGVYTEASNSVETTLSFWMKTGNITANKRVLQMYGAIPTGYRFEYDGSNFYVNLAIEDVSSNPSGGYAQIFAPSVDDNNWHHVVVRTAAFGINGVEIEVFLDNVNMPIALNPIFTTPDYLTHFIEGAHFIVSPISNYSGAVDDIFFYQSALTDIEIGQLYNALAPPCTVTIPNTIFKNHLLADLTINTNGNSEIECAEATAFTGTINVNAMGITDLTGIEAFTNLTILHTNENSLTSLDLSANTSLQYFYCEDNGGLASLLVPNTNTLLQMTCDGNSISNLDVSGRAMLNYLKCDHNGMQTLNVSNCTALGQLICGWNQLVNLDLSTNVNLFTFLTGFNAFTSLDLSANIALTNAGVGYNGALTSLNIANGNNAALTGFDATSCGNLTCIQVDNATAAAGYANWYKDATAIYSENCQTVGISEATTETFSVYPNPAVNTLTIANASTAIAKMTIVDVTGKTVKTVAANTTTIDVANLTSGVYFLHVQTEDKLVTKKFVKQ
ncbi:MAG: T9SS type A sorting domain-containing protein [Flavobacteriales bacterium]